MLISTDFFSKGKIGFLGSLYNLTSQNYHIVAETQQSLIVFNLKPIPKCN